MFKIDNKDTRTVSLTSIKNVKHILDPFLVVSIVDFEHVNITEILISTLQNTGTVGTGLLLGMIFLGDVFWKQSSASFVQILKRK